MKGIFRLSQVTRRSEMLSLAAKIKDDYPYSISMYNNLLMNVRGHNRCFQYQFYVPADNPESHVIIWIKMTMPRDMSIHCNKREISLATRLAQSEDFLALMKEDPGIIGMNHVPDYLTHPLFETLKSVFNKSFKIYPFSTFSYVSPQSYPLSCPAGMKVRRLNKDSIHHLLQLSKSNKGDDFCSTVKLTNSLPALGFYLDPSFQEESLINLDTLEFADSEEIPVSWISAHHYGPFGMLKTHDAYKRRGLAIVLIEMMARLLYMEGYFPHAPVQPHNAAVFKLFGRLPGWKNTHDVNWFAF